MDANELLKKLLQEQEVKDLEFQGQLQDAQNRRDERVAQSKMLEAGNALARAFTQTQADPNLLKDSIQRADQPLQDVMLSKKLQDEKKKQLMDQIRFDVENKKAQQDIEYNEKARPTQLEALEEDLRQKKTLFPLTERSLEQQIQQSGERFGMDQERFKREKELYPLDFNTKKLQAKKDQMEYEQSLSFNDPNSPQSLAAVKMMKDVLNAAGYKELSNTLTEGKTSMRDLNSPAYKNAYETIINAQSRKDTQTLKKEEQQEKLNIKKEELLNKDLQKLTDKLAPAQDLASALDRVNTQLGFDIDDLLVDTKKDKLIHKGKEVDLPGANVKGLGRVSIYDPEARNLASAIQDVFNLQLKDRSGAAVTSEEMRRLQRGMSKGLFNTESEMIKALQEYKKAVATELKNREAGFSPEVVKTYKDRGGVTSDIFYPKGSQKAKIKVTNGEDVFEIDESDLADAEKDGYKRL